MKILLNSKTGMMTCTRCALVSLVIHPCHITYITQLGFLNSRPKVPPEGKGAGLISENQPRF